MASKQLVVTVRAHDLMTPTLRRSVQQILGFGRTIGSVTTGPIAAMARSLISMRTLFVGLASGVAIHRMAASFNAAATTLDDMAKASARMGIGVEQLSSLKYTADLANVSFEELLQGLETAQKNLGEFAATGSGRASKAIRLLGLELRDTDGRLRDMTELLPEIADQINAIGSPEQRQFLIQKIFGESGRGFLNLLAEGGDRLRAFNEEARRLNLIFTPEQAAVAEEYRDAISRVQAAWLGLRVNLLTKVGPALTEILNQMASFVAAVPEMVGNLVTTLRDAFSGGEAGLEARLVLNDVFDTIRDVVATGIGEVIAVAITAIIDGSKAMKALLIPIMSKLAEEIMIDPLVTVVEKIAPALGQRLRGAATGIEAVTDLGLLQKIRTSLAEAFGPDSLTQQSLLMSGTTMGGAFDAAAEAMDRLFGASEALAKTSLPELSSALRDAAAAGRELGSQNTFMDGFREGWEDLLESATRAAEQGRAVFDVIAQSITGELADAIVDTISGVKSLEDAFRDFASSSLRELSRVITRVLLLRAIGEIGGLFGGGSKVAPAIGYTGSTAFAARGGILRAGQLFTMAAGAALMPASGGAGRVVTRPEIFPLARGVGLRGEAGPEAVMPLKRINGRLGVEASGGAGTNIVINVTVASGAHGDAREIANAIRRVIRDVVPEAMEQSPQMVQRMRRRLG